MGVPKTGFDIVEPLTVSVNEQRTGKQEMEHGCKDGSRERPANVFGHQNGREPVTTGRHRPGRNHTTGRFFQYQSILIGKERNNTLCSKGSRDRLSQADAATGD
jgi:hypothetical protein